MAFGESTSLDLYMYTRTYTGSRISFRGEMFNSEDTENVGHK